MHRSIRWTLNALASLILLAGSGPPVAAVTQDWPLSGIFGAEVTPDPPQPGVPLLLTIHGLYPYDCGEIADTSVAATHIAFTVRPRTTACADTTRHWSFTFPLGALSSGVHTITVERRLVHESGKVEDATGSFEIGVGMAPPPPEPTCPLFSHFTLSPDPATDDGPTVVTLHGCFPWRCGEIVDAHLVGPTQIDMTIAERSCADSMRTWSRAFDLGILPAGGHNLIVTIHDAAKPGSGEVFGQMFTVLGDVPPPPPPPPPPPSGPLFASAWTVPSPATTAAPTLLVASGYFAYECGFISEAEVLSPTHVSLVARRGAECVSDSARAWQHAFDLGILASGAHTVQISIRDAGTADSLVVQEFSTTFDVVDAGPPPPPPPVDSLTASHPNPFVDQTRFAVVLDQAAPIEVRVFDLRGRAVRHIFKGLAAAGSQSYVWDGRRDDGSRAAAGIYFYRVSMRGRVLSRRTVLLTGS